MAVKTIYVVERKGKEVMKSTSKKEADAHDKTLDIGDEIVLLLNDLKVDLTDIQKEEIGIYLSKEREPLGRILRGQKLEKINSTKEKPSPVKDTKK